MHTLTLQDLSASVDLDRKAMAAVHGGADDQAIGTSQSNAQGMAAAANLGNASLFAGPATLQSDNTFRQGGCNVNTAFNIDALLVLGRWCAPAPSLAAGPCGMANR